MIKKNYLAKHRVEYQKLSFISAPQEGREGMVKKIEAKFCPNFCLRKISNRKKKTIHTLKAPPCDIGLSQSLRFLEVSKTL